MQSVTSVATAVGAPLGLPVPSGELLQQAPKVDSIYLRVEGLWRFDLLSTGPRHRVIPQSVGTLPLQRFVVVEDGPADWAQFHRQAMADAPDVGIGNLYPSLRSQD